MIELMDGIVESFNQDGKALELSDTSETEVDVFFTSKCYIIPIHHSKNDVASVRCGFADIHEIGIIGVCVAVFENSTVVQSDTTVIPLMTLLSNKDAIYKAQGEVFTNFWKAIHTAAEQRR